MSGESEKKSVLLDHVRRYLESSNLKYSESQDGKAVSLSVRMGEATLHFIAQASEEQNYLVFLSNIEARVPEARRQAVAEYITRANYGLLHGNFEMDFRDGEVRYKTSVLSVGGAVSDEAVSSLIGMNFGTYARYYPGLMAVMYGGKEPALALSEIESKRQDGGGRAN